MTSEVAIKCSQNMARLCSRFAIIPTNVQMAYQVAYGNEKRPERGVFVRLLAERAGFSVKDDFTSFPYRE